MNANREEVIRCADDLTTLIANQEKSGKNMYDYLRTDFLKDIGGKVQVKGAIILVVMGAAYVEYLTTPGSLLNPKIAQRNAFYTAVTVGCKIMKAINSDINWMGALYTVISNSSTIIKDLNVTVDEIKEVMELLNAPVEEFNNINDASGHVALQGINNDFAGIAMTLDMLGGVKNG